ncbi:MAG: hypothetical protein FJ387_30205 [Verrucomicrobia bacterium]|nr:hypothetical protein [Verrucomicrobiota bacterium]
MRTIEQEELYRNLNQFLQDKGIQLKDGSVSRNVKKVCSILTDLVNRTQGGFHDARVRLDQKLDELRRAIHEKTAPKASKANRAGAAGGAGAENGSATKPARRKAKVASSRRKSAVRRASRRTRETQKTAVMPE